MKRQKEEEEERKNIKLEVSQSENQNLTYTFFLEILCFNYTINTWDFDGSPHDYASPSYINGNFPINFSGKPS